MSKSVPLRRRPLYTGIIGGVEGVALVASPLMGGALTDHLSWRWIFYLNLPVGIFAMMLIYLCFKAAPNEAALNTTWKEKLRRLDILGTAIFVPAIVSLLLALQWGGSEYQWSSGRIVGLLVVFAVLMVAFVGVQIWKKEFATIPPRIIKQRSMALGMWFSIAMGAGLVLMDYFVSYLLENQMGFRMADSF